MLLQLPVELQQRVIGCLSTSQALNFREVSRECKDLASSCIQSASLSCIGDLAQMTKSFPCISQLTVKPETDDDALLLFESFLPEKLCSFPATLEQLTIDANGFDTIYAYKVAALTRACRNLNDVRLSGHCINLDADADFLQKLTEVQTVRGDSAYPISIFSDFGVSGPASLSSCSNLRRLHTFTKSSRETAGIVSGLAGCRQLETLKLFVPYATDVLSAPAYFPSVKRLELMTTHDTNFSFDLSAFSQVEFLLIALISMVPEYPPPGTQLRFLTTAWLENIKCLLGLRDAPHLTTLGLAYSLTLPTTHNFDDLRYIPQLQRLQICDHDVAVGDLLACPRLQEVVLVDVIGTSFCRPF